MGDERELDSTGAYSWEPVLDETEPPPEEASNPSGIARGECDLDSGEHVPDCEHEITAQVDDMFMEETKPGYGIPGFEGEESGGG